MKDMSSKISHFKSQISNLKGFTLLEIMIALAIIGMTLMTVLHTVNYHANIANENTASTQMTQLAKEKLFDLEANPVSSSGSIEGTGFTYENIVSATEDPEIIELKSIVKGQGKEVLLNEIIRNNAGTGVQAQ
ncbi:MAG: prepilin-type N-terminal cleavage/methylation domain-containing protein [Nitrospiraceae bacterium]|nr:MAG: prepilin-type N-terminal cleavage/methylation domain-containing protein [Nitrospiraceae bacterium]